MQTWPRSQICKCCMQCTAIAKLDQYSQLQPLHLSSTPHLYWCKGYFQGTLRLQKLISRSVIHTSLSDGNCKSGIGVLPSQASTAAEYSIKLSRETFTLLRGLHALTWSSVQMSHILHACSCAAHSLTECRWRIARFYLI